MNDISAAVTLLAVDPGLGAVLRGGPGPVRDRFLAEFRRALPDRTPFLRMPAAIDEIALLGGLDLAATLASGKPVLERGMLARAAGGVLVAAMAERMPASTAGIVGHAVDAEPSLAVVALDEGIADERAPPALLDRLALHLEVAGPEAPETEPATAAAARARLADVVTTDQAIAALTGTAMALGVSSLRAPLLAVRAARAAAAVAGRLALDPADLELAARLVLAPRATIVPVPPEAAPPETPEAEHREPDDAEGTGQLADQVLEAARAALPPGLLAAIAAGAMRSRETGAAGARQKAATRGRPVGARRGDPRRGRLAVLETLRAAAPWQRIRGAERGRIAVRRDDFRIRRFAAQTRSTTLFVVDASGSAALHRLAEAKGAVELLLAECYVRRDRVALLSMRGKGVELLLPPTSSLARAKRCLAALPGGGGTPLAAGIEAATLLADQIRRGGQTPTVVFLTDARANIALDGTGGRPRAEQDAEAASRRLRAAGIAALLVDIGPSRHPFAPKLAAAMGARYLVLPHADAGMLARAVAAA